MHVNQRVIGCYGNVPRFNANPACVCSNCSFCEDTQERGSTIDQMCVDHKHFEEKTSRARNQPLSSLKDHGAGLSSITVLL